VATEKEFEAETQREALELACAEFGVSEEQLDYTIVDMGSAGLFGMGARPFKLTASVGSKGSKVKEVEAPKAAAPDTAQVSAPEVDEAPAPEVDEAPVADDSSELVQAQSDAEEAEAPVQKRAPRTPGIVGPAPEKAAQAKEVALALTQELKMDVNIDIRDEETEIVIVLSEVEDSTAVADLLGSTRPPALPSFQFLLNKIVNRFPDNRKHIVVEAESVSARIVARKAEAAERRKQNAKAPKKTLAEDIDEEMVAIAQQLVEKANALGKVITILPMSAGDRRAIHQTVMTIENAETVSEGDGLFRRIHVVPDALRTKRSSGRRRRRGPPRDRPDDAPKDEEAASAPAEAGEEQAASAPVLESAAPAPSDDGALANAPVVEASAEADTANP
jgi:spoIIIJ-associated protein